MAQKIVSYEVAKAIEHIGYPQELTDEVYSEIGELVSSAYGEWHKCYDAPTYIEVWLWLWREKGIIIDVDYSECGWYVCIDEESTDDFNDPEEAIAKAIDYLVKNNLIK